MSDFTQNPTLADSLVSSDLLLARRSDIARRVAPLRALYGGQGYMGERMFKLDEARIATAIRARLRDAGEKTTEPQIDALVRTNADYIAALAKDIDQRRQWVELEEELNDIEWRLRCRQSDASLLSAEARIQ